MKDIPITEVREELTTFPEELGRTHETIAVTRRGKPVLAILSWEEYEALVETLEILGDHEEMARLQQAVTEFKQGKSIPWNEAKRKIGL